MRGGRQLLGAIVLIALLTALGTGLATAGSGYKTKTKSTVLQVGDESRVRARACPGTSEDVGSGFDVGAYDPTGTGPRGELTAVLEGFASAVNTGGTAGELTAEHYCSKRHHGIRRPNANVQLAPGESGMVRRNCDPGLRAITAGFESRMKDFNEANLHELRVVSAFIDSRRERGIVVADNTSATKEFRVYVYVTCYRHGPKMTLRSASTDVAPGATATATARCPQRFRAIGGGFKADSGTYALSGRAAGERRWRVRAVREGTGPGKLTATAHCIRRS